MMLSILCALSLGVVARPPKVDPVKWTLTWSDEFDGPMGQQADPQKWNHDLGSSGFGNNELEDYTDGNKNAFLDGHGHLVIEARNEGTSDHPRYTSARIKTEGLFSQTYGRFEARIKLPKGKGIWPAFWTLGDDIGKAGWPGCGELDIMEYQGQHPNVQIGTAHGPGYSGGQGMSGRITLDKGDLSDDYHIYAIDWEPDRIQWFLDDKCYHTLLATDLGTRRWVFDHPFFVILNLAVGGNFVGSPDATTEFPQRLMVDYVRVYRAKK